MGKVILKFKRIEVGKVDTRNNVMELFFCFDENGREMKHRKSYPLDMDVDNFVNSLINEIKVKSHERNAVVVDDDDFLSYHMNILIDEPEPGVAKDKIANALRRFKDKVRSFRNIRQSDNYITHYNELVGLKADIE
ncbi:MAG TPA: hypothetical protein HA362_07900 [Nanoarchaeota archaeon]|nr:hypothetical protein [Nanoarchaeota archaeon]